MGAEAAGVAGPNANDGLLAVGVAKGAGEGLAPNWKGDFAGVAGVAAEAPDPKVNGLLGPDDVEGNSGFGASTVSADVEDEDEDGPKVKGLGASPPAPVWFPPNGDVDGAGAPNKDVFGGSAASDDFEAPTGANNGFVSAGLVVSLLG